MRRDDPPSPRLTALLLAPLGALLLVVGGWAGASTPSATVAVATDAPPEDAPAEATVADRRARRSATLLRHKPAPSRRRLLAAFPRRPLSQGPRNPAIWLSTPLRGPPALLS
jgi:hypothetical protein